MLFHSPHANLQVICSKTLIKFHPVTGDEVERVPAIWANFGKLGPSRSFTNPETGEEMQGAEIIGHFFDTDLEAAQNDWSEDTKAMVERKLLGLCQREPSRITVVKREVPRAGLPWPTFDDLDAKQAVALARQLGLAAEALAYERENRGRPAVIDALEATQGDEDESVVEPVAAASKPGVVADPDLRTITV